jgi:hypothetical protein
MHRGIAILPTQAGVALLALIGFAFAPPAQGRLLLVPITGNERAALNVALDGDARLLGAGPLRGSLVVAGSRDRFASAALDRGILILAAPSSWCGGPGDNE